MSDNVIKFRRIEKKPEKPPRKDFRLSGWLAWVILVLVACALVALQQAGLLGW